MKTLFECRNLKEGIFLLFVLLIGFFSAVNAFSPALAVKTFGFNFSVVQSGSMEPVLSRGDLLFICQTDPDTIKKEDIIAFQPKNQLRVLHSVADILTDDQGERVFKTKPYQAKDKSEWDYWGIRDNQIIGRLVFSVPSVGHLILFLSSWVGLLTLALILVAWTVYDHIKER